MHIKFSIMYLLAGALILASCKKDNGDDDDPTLLRRKVDYSSLNSNTEYTNTFKDRQGNSTVEMKEARMLSDMLNDLDLHIKTVTEANPAPLTSRPKDMYLNRNNPFGPAEFNTSGISLRSRSALSYPAAEAEQEREDIEAHLDALILASQAVANTASEGRPGRLAGTYLVDGRGIEHGQIIQKAVAGAVLLDQIVNLYLADAALGAGNDSVVEGKPYTALEHNWDMAYGLLTPNSRFGVVDGSGNWRERFLGSYMVEYNAAALQPVYLAFLKGRAAIVNREPAVWREQADLIRTELEKTVALNALANLQKYKDNTSPAIRAHAWSEALGHIYSLRYCRKNGADRTWSETVMSNLHAPNGFWGLTDAQIDAGMTAIRTKFNLPG